MTETRDRVLRDLRLWPAGALPASIAAGVGFIGVGTGLVVASADRGTTRFALTLACTVVAGIVGGVYMTLGQRYRLRLGRLGGKLVAAELVSVAALFAVFLADGQLGFAVACGFLGVGMLANARMIRIVRAGRLARADSVDDGDRVALPRHAAPPPRPTIGQLLHDNVAVRQRRWIAWVVAAVVSMPAAAALGAWDEAIGLMIVTALIAVPATLLRWWPVSRSQRRFARAEAEPRRAFVAVPFDGFLRRAPMLAIWSQPPTLSEGRLPPPERTYRIDPRHDGLVGDQVDLDVHEAWIDTSSRRPRWVLADAGLAVPRRWSVFGRFYLFSHVARVALPHWLTVTAPHPSAEPATDPRFDRRRFGIALAQRLAVFVVLAVILSAE